MIKPSGTVRNCWQTVKKMLVTILLLLGATSLFAQTRTIEGKLLNLAGEPIPNAHATLDTPEKEQTTTGHDGSFRLETSQFPTGIRITENNPTLAPGLVTVQIMDLSSKMLAQTTGTLSAGNTLRFNPTRRLNAHTLYLLRITDQNHQTHTGKYMFHSTQPHELTLKSGNASDTFNYHIRFSGDTFADTTLLVKGFPKTGVYHYQDFGVNEKPAIIGSYKGERFNADTLNILLDTLFKTDDALKYDLIFSGANNAKIDDNILKVYGNSKFDLKATDGINQSVILSGMDFEQYNSLNIFVTELFSDSIVKNANVKLWDGVSKVYEPVKIEDNKHLFEVENKNQHYQVMITSPDFTERNAFVNMNKNLVDTVMTIVPKEFFWHFYAGEYQMPGEAGFPMDLKFEKGIKPIIYLVNSKEFIRETTNPDVKGMLEYLASHFTEKKTIENFTYGKIDALKDNQIVWLDSYSQVPNFRDKNQYFVALVMNNKMGNNGGASSVPHGLTLGTGKCEFQPHTNTNNLDEIFYEEVGTVLAGARGVYNGDRKTSTFEDSGPPNFTEYNHRASKVYVSRENLIQVKNENGYTDNDIPPYEGSLKDPKSVNIIFKTYQEAINITNNAYTNFKNFINSKK